MGIMRSISQTVRAYTLYKEERLSVYGLSGNQSLYLRTIIQKPGITQEELADRLVFNKSSVSRQIAAMEKAGLIRQERRETDKRNLHIFATPEGEALEGVILETARDFFNLITEGMSPEEKSSLDALCQKICANAKEAIRKK